VIPNDELERRIKALENKIKETDVDLIIATSQENFFYMTGVLIHTQKSAPDRLEMVCLDKAGEIFTVICNLEYPLFTNQSTVEDISVYVEFADSPIKSLSDQLAKRGYGNKKIGIETGHLVAKYFKELTDHMPNAQFLPWDHHFDEVRLFKSQYEIEIMEKAARITEEVIYETWRAAEYGISEIEMGFELEWRLRKQGADKISFVTCASGIRSTIPHAIPSASPIERGDLIKIDFGGVFNGYKSDVARVAFMSEVSKERRDDYQRFVQAYKETINVMRPGTTIAEVFNRSKEINENLGLPFEQPHLGHSIGIVGHENPLIHPFDHTELKPGMLFALEPRSKIREKDRYHIEDLILITESGPKVLTDIDSIENVFVIS